MFRTLAGQASACAPPPPLDSGWNQAGIRLNYETEFGKYKATAIQPAIRLKSG